METTTELVFKKEVEVTIQPGHVVRLKSDKYKLGTRVNMTVESINDTRVKTVWFDENQILQQATFEFDCLELVS